MSRRVISETKTTTTIITITNELHKIKRFHILYHKEDRCETNRSGNGRWRTKVLSESLLPPLHLS